jgi:hypothetical protein
MTKDDLIWVVIRGAGLVLVIRAILYLPEFIGLLAWAIYLGDMSVSTTDGERISIGTSRHQVIYTFAYFLCYGALGVYLLRRGAWIHRLMRHIGSERSNTTPHADARDVPAPADAPGARAGGRER